MTAGSLLTLASLRRPFLKDLASSAAQAATVADRRAGCGEQHRCRQGDMMWVVHTAQVLVGWPASSTPAEAAAELPQDEQLQLVAAIEFFSQDAAANVVWAAPLLASARL